MSKHDVFRHHPTISTCGLLVVLVLVIGISRLGMGTTGGLYQLENQNVFDGPRVQNGE